MSLLPGNSTSTNITNEGAIVSQELIECLEQTLAEMESQQLATQQLLNDTLEELECLYCEFEAKSQELRELQAEDLEFSPAPAQAADATAVPGEALQMVQEERDALERQLQELQAEVEDAVSPEQPTSAPAATESETVDECESASIDVPFAENIHARFERLRQQLAASKASKASAASAASDSSHASAGAATPAEADDVPS